MSFNLTGGIFDIFGHGFGHGRLRRNSKHRSCWLKLGLKWPYLKRSLDNTFLRDIGNNGNQINHQILLLLILRTH